MSTSPVPNGAPLVPHHEIEHVFRRAAELQEQAEQNASRASTGAGSSPRAATDGWTAAEVVAMAREAGIAHEFVQQAIGESLSTAPRITSSHLDLVQRLEATRLVEASVPDAFAAVKKTAEASPWRLHLVDAERTPEGGVRVALDPTRNMMTAEGELSPFANGMLMAGLNFQRIEVEIEPAGADSSMLRVRALPSEGSRPTLRFLTGLTGMAGGGAGGGLGVAGSVALGLAGWAVVPLAAVAALAGIAAGIKGFSAGVRYTVRKDADGIQKLLGAIAARIQTQALAAGRDGPGTSTSLPPA